MAGELLLVLDRRDLLVRLEGRALRVEGPDGLLQRAPLTLLGMVVVHGAPLVACDVWRALAEHGIPAVLTPLRGRTTIWLGCGLSNTIQVRRRQHAAAQQPGTRLAIARTLVALKIHQYRRLVQGLGTALDADRLDAALGRARTALDGASDTPTLMGLEGAAAAAWYGWLANSLPAHWRFTGRNRRPPRDPLNALLSLGYTLLGGEMLGAVQEAGLDPALGFLHGVVPGRESLVLDLMEPLRPGVDAFALQLLDEVFQPTDFNYHQQTGCRLNKSARGTFYARWAETRRSWPLLLPAEIGPEPTPEEPELYSEDGIGTAGDTRLRTQCRRMVRGLRGLLPALTLEVEEDGGTA